MSSLNTLPESTWNAAEAFKFGMVSTDVKFNSIILRISHRKIMEPVPLSKRQDRVLKNMFEQVQIIFINKQPAILK